MIGQQHKQQVGEYKKRALEQEAKMAVGELVPALISQPKHDSNDEQARSRSQEVKSDCAIAAAAPTATKTLPAATTMNEPQTSPKQIATSSEPTTQRQIQTRAALKRFGDDERGPARRAPERYCRKTTTSKTTTTTTTTKAHKTGAIAMASASAAKQRPPQPARQMGQLLVAVAWLAMAVLVVGLGRPADGRVTFEKMTNRDYSGVNYYTIQNVSLFECLGWCKEETSCTSAVFSFVVNPFAALQETTCMLQNETHARQGAYLRSTSNGEQVVIAAQPQKATNLYFFNKIELQTESVCSRLWAFERFPNRRLRQRDRQPFHAPSKESCQAACMSEQRFVCRSIEYNYISQQCVLSAYDRRSPLVQHLAAQSMGGGGSSSSSSSSSSAAAAAHQDLIEAPGSDYFENACLLGEDICNESRIYDYAKVGMPLQRVAHFVELNYYPDKEMLVKSQAGCVRACTIEHEFICRSILYRSTFKQGQPNCALYHLDQRTFPEGADAFMSHVMQPLLDSGETSAVYLEAICNDTISSSASSGPPTTITMPPTSITILPSSTTPNGVSVFPGSHQQLMQQQHQHQQQQNHSSDLERFINAAGSSSTSTLSPIMGPPTTIRLPTSFMPPVGSSTHQPGQIPSNIQISELPGGRPMSIPSHITISPPGGNGNGGGMGSAGRPSIGMPNHITISPAPPPRDPLDATSGIPTNLQVSVSGSGSQSVGPSNHDQNCDAHGFCYDVALKCTDTKMVVNVKTQRPFFGRIYALGRSETCNANIKNQNQFQLDMYLTGQECNTQSAVSSQRRRAPASFVHAAALFSSGGGEADVRGRRVPVHTRTAGMVRLNGVTIGAGRQQQVAKFRATHTHPLR
jgi:hypothetical protein